MALLVLCYWSLLLAQIFPRILSLKRRRSAPPSSHVKKSFRTNFESQPTGPIYSFLTNENLLPYLFISVSGLIDNWDDIYSLCQLREVFTGALKGAALR